MSNIELPSQQYIFSTFSGVPIAARELIWNIFFASRNRGVDLSTHFPWIEEESETYCLTLSEKNKGPILATLVLREINLYPGLRYGIVGMVCVDESFRGQGLCSRLLVNLRKFSLDKKITSLLLWTREPSIYIKQGFVIDTSDNFGQITFNPLRPLANIDSIKVHPVHNRGLPAFAQKLIHYDCDLAELIVAETAQGVTVAEWEGAPSAVLDMRESTLPLAGNLNAPANASIFYEISKRGHIYTPFPSSSRMVLHLDKKINLPYISVLDRI